MNIRVRDFFRIETKDIITFENWDQIYYVFEQMVEYDVDVPELEGLRERLPYAFNKIATEKLDRNDIITFFPIIWGKFESYAKKLLFITNPSEYAEIRKNKDKSLVKVLQKMQTNVFTNPKDRDNETEAIYTAYELRNNEAHECEKWSVRKCYDKLAKVMAAFLIITNKALPELQLAMQAMPDERKIRILPLRKICDIGVDIFDIRYNQNLFFNLNDYYTQYCSVDLYRYDKKGWLLSDESIHYGYKNKTEYLYEKREGMVVKRIGHIIRTNMNNNNEEKEDDSEYRIYNYDDENKLVRVEIIRGNYRDNKYSKRIIVDIDYLTNGGIKIIKKEIIPMDRYIKSDSDTERIGIIDVKEFDCEGRLLAHNGIRGDVKYVYSDNGSLSRIEYSDYSFDEIKTIGDNQLIIHKDNLDNQGYLKEKRLYSEGKLMMIQKYSIFQKGRRMENAKLSEEIKLKYY